MAQSNPRNVQELQDELRVLDPRYVVEKIIGSGSYGVVIKARDTTDNSLVAIKRINKEIFDESILAKRILREIKLLAHFHDVNIIGLRNILTPRTPDFDAFFIVMEIMDTDLRAVLKSGQRLSDQHVQFFVYQALRALHVIHAAGVIHRDITPANILVNTNCDLKICDFGLAKEESDDGQDMTDYVTMRWYRAPELVMEHRNYTGKIDVWGVGLIFGELLGSRPLCQGKDRVVQLDKIIEVIGTPSDEDIDAVGSAAAQRYLKKKGPRQPINWTEKYPAASPEALDLLQKMLAFHPDKRISVVDGMRHPYLSAMYDAADEQVDVPPFEFDENQYNTVRALKEAILQESVMFHRRYPTQSPIAASGSGSRVDVGEADGRSSDSTLEKRDRDVGKYEDHHP